MEVCSSYDSGQTRALVYRLLSGLFLSEVTKDFLNSLARCDLNLEGELGAFIGVLKQADLDAVRKETTSEFAALLLNMSPDPVHPYESVYRSSRHMLMQQSRDQVLDEYRREKLQYTRRLNIPEDHIGIEFEFMERLCEKERDAHASGNMQVLHDIREAQRMFLTEHLKTWVPQLCDDLEKRAKTLLYRGLAETTRAFLKFECEFLNVEE